MKIDYLKLCNIGPYVGVHSFDLETTPEQNIILIGGKNGAGKTTFLKSVKFGLFGSFSIGQRNDTALYLKNIDEMLNDNAEGPFYIEIKLEYVEELENHIVIIHREWKKEKDNLVESVSVYHNDLDDKMTDYQATELLEKIKSITSPQLINSYMFDGEKIASFILEDRISEYLQETFQSMFGINLINQSIKDLETFRTKKAAISNSQSEIENVTLINNIDGYKARLKTLDNEIQRLTATKKNLSAIRKSNMDKLIRLGGLTKKEFQEKLNRVSTINKDKELISKVTKDFLETDFPLYLCRDLLKKSLRHAKEEEKIRCVSYLDEIESLVGKQLPNLRKEVLEKVGEGKEYLYLSKEQTHQLENRITAIDNDSSKLKSLLNRKAERNDEYKFLKDIISRNVDVEGIDELLDLIREDDNALKNNETTLWATLKERENLTKELSVQLKVYDAIFEKYKKDMALNNSFVLAQKSIDVLTKEKDYLQKTKLKEVSKEALRIFTKTISKQNYVSDILLKPDFTLHLINSSGAEMSPKTLSAGEMQILVSSLVYSMFKVSRRREMFVFDTPLARLDSSNRINFIREIVSSISDQVVILSTDSEFIAENYVAIKDRISRNYMLTYDSTLSSTTVTDQYFQKGESER